MKLIDILHIKLTRKYNWYAKWHMKHRSNLINWAIFFGSCLIIASLGTASLAFAQSSLPFPESYIPASVQATATPIPTPKTEEKITTYTVLEGDTLWTIAESQLGDGTKYQEIIDLNKDTYPSLVTAPDELTVGWNLIVKKETVTAAAAPSVSTGGEITVPTANVVTGGEITKPIGFLDIFNIFALVLLGLIIVGLVIRYLVWRF